MKYKDGKPGYNPDKNARVLPMTILLFVLCGFSFYLGGIFCSEKEVVNVKTSMDVGDSVASPRDTAVSPLQLKPVTFQACSSDYQDYTPCTDPRVFSMTFISKRVYQPCLIFTYECRNGRNMVCIVLLSWNDIARPCSKERNA